MTPQEVAEQVCGMYCDITITPYATVNGIEWTCEIINKDSTDKTSAVCIQGCETIDEAVTQAYEDFCNTEGTHYLQKSEKDCRKCYKRKIVR